MTIPAEPSVHVVATLMRPAGHDVLHRPCEDVTVVRQTRRERRPVVKYVSVKQKQVTRKRCIYETKFQCTRKKAFQLEANCPFANKCLPPLPTAWGPSYYMDLFKRIVFTCPPPH